MRMVRDEDPVKVGLWKPNGAAGRRIEYVLDADETRVVLKASGEVRVIKASRSRFDLAWWCLYPAAAISAGWLTGTSANCGSTPSPAFGARSLARASVPE